MDNFLRALSTNAASKLNILRHDGNALSMDGAQVGVLEQSNQVSLSSFLESQDSRSLEAEISLEVLSDLADKALEGELADQELSALLVSSDLTKSDGSWAVTMRLLDSSSCRSALTSSLGGELLAGSFATSGLASGLLDNSGMR